MILRRMSQKQCLKSLLLSLKRGTKLLKFRTKLKVALSRNKWGSLKPLKKDKKICKIVQCPSYNQTNVFGARKGVLRNGIFCNKT